MDQAIMVIKKYYSGFDKFEGMDDKTIKRKLIVEWNKLEQDWFIKYLKESLANNSIDLVEVISLLKSLKMELNPITLKDILVKCPELDTYLSCFFLKGKQYKLEELERHKGAEVLIVYATLKDMILDDSVDSEINYEGIRVDSAEQMYLAEIKKIPIMPWEKMVELFEKIDEYKKLLKKAKDSELKRKYQEKIAFYQNKIVEGNLRLVVKMVNRYINCGMDLADLMQEGNLGLMRSVQTFDVSVGVKFSTYSMWWIRQAIQRFIFENDRVIKVPINRRERFNKIKKEKDRLEQILGREATTLELAKSLNMNLKDLETFIADFGNIQSLDQSKQADEEDTNPYEYIPSDEHFEDEVINREMASSLLVKLPKDEEEIIRLRFAIMVDENDKKHYRKYTFEEISVMFGVTRERIRQKEKTALKRLESYARGKVDEVITITPVLFFDNFLEYDQGTVLKYFTGLTPSEKMILQERYGKNLDEFNIVCKTTIVKVNSILKHLQRMIKKGLEQEQENPWWIKQYEGKSLMEITELGIEKIVGILGELDENDIVHNILVKAFGANLDEPFYSFKLSVDELNLILDITVKIILRANEFLPNAEILLDEDIPYIRSPFTNSLIRTFTKYIPAEYRQITEVCLGIFDGKMYPLAEVATMFNISLADTRFRRDEGIKMFVSILAKNQKLLEEYMPTLNNEWQSMIKLIREK